MPITGPNPCPLPTRTVAALAHVGNIVRIDLLDAVEVLGEVARDLDPSPERRTVVVANAVPVPDTGSEPS